MKKVFTVLSIILVFFLVSCASMFSYEEKETSAEVVNPWKTFSTLKQAQSNLSFSVSVPQEIALWKPYLYRVLGTDLAEVIYLSDGNGSFNIRKSATDDPIEGDYTEYPVRYNTVVNGAYLTVMGLEEGSLKAASWMYEGHSYYLLFEQSQSDEIFFRVADSIIYENKVHTL